MMVIFVSKSEKKAIKSTQRVLDAFANRIGDNTWQTAITKEGLEKVLHLVLLLVVIGLEAGIFLNYYGLSETKINSMKTEMFLLILHTLKFLNTIENQDGRLCLLFKL